MRKILKIDRALYEVDKETRTYRYFGRNKDWRKLSEKENRKNKSSIDGFTRIFPNGKRKIFRLK